MNVQVQAAAKTRAGASPSKVPNTLVKPITTICFNEQLPLSQPVFDLSKKEVGRESSTEGTRIQVLKVPRGRGMGAYPLPRKFLIFFISK